MDWSVFLSQAFLIALFSAAIRLALPVLLAALGEIVTELSGVLNLGLEGIMAMGAFVGFTVAFLIGNTWIGLLAAAAVGALMGLLMAFVAVTLKIDQVVAGIVFVLFGTGLSNFLFRQTFGISGKPPRVPLLPGVEIPILSDIPYVGTILFGQNPVFYLTLLMVVTLWIAIDRTTWGLKTRATGELPSAADTAGANVTRLRYIATIIGAALAGLGGGFLTAGQLGLFLEGVIAGRGWVALALVIFARWRPGLAVIGALVFGLADAIQFRLQALAPAEVPYEVFLMLPYAMTIVALWFGGKRSAQPAALGEPYVKGKR